MYIQSNLFSTPIWQLDSNGRKDHLLNNSTMNFNTNKLNIETAINLHDISRTDREPLSQSVKMKIKVADEDPLKVKMLKNFGPMHQNGIQWDEIEQSLMSSMSAGYVGYIITDNGSEKPVETIGGVEFIDRFVITETSFENKITKVFSGNEIEDNLKKLKAIASNVREKLIDHFAAEFNEFFNGSAADLSNSTQRIEATNFDTSKFKINLESIFQQKSEGIPQGSKDSSIENMDYESINVIYKTMQEFKESMKVGISATSEVIGAHAGIAKAKTDLVLKYSQLDDPLKEKFSDAINRNINISINDLISKRNEYADSIRREYGIDPRLSVADRESILNNAALFENILEDRENFVSAYNKNMDGIGLKYMSNSTEYTNLPGYIDPKRPESIYDSLLDTAMIQRKKAFNDISDKLAEDWNRFVERTDIENKKSFYVPNRNYNIVDVLI